MSRIYGLTDEMIAAGRKELTEFFSRSEFRRDCIKDDPDLLARSIDRSEECVVSRIFQIMLVTRDGKDSAFKEGDAVKLKLKKYPDDLAEVGDIGVITDVDEDKEWYIANFEFTDGRGYTFGTRHESELERCEDVLFTKVA